VYRRYLQQHNAAIKWQGDQVYGNSANELEASQRALPQAVVDWPQEDKLSTARDDRIAANVLEVVRAHANQRIAIVYGSAHYLPLKRRLEAVPTVCRERATRSRNSWTGRTSPFFRRSLDCNPPNIPRSHALFVRTTRAAIVSSLTMAS